MGINAGLIFYRQCNEMDVNARAGSRGGVLVFPIFARPSNLAVSKHDLHFSDSDFMTQASQLLKFPDFDLK